MKSIRFIFLTRCYRQTNLAVIKRNLQEVFADSFHVYIHIILVDLTHGERRDKFNVFEDERTIVRFVDYKQPNDTQLTRGMDAVLKEVGSDQDYVYILDDDNLIKKEFLEVGEYCNDEDAVVFKVEDHPWGDPSIVNGDPVGKIDWSNFVTKLKTMRRLEIYHGGATSICEDGIFFWKMLNDTECKIRFVDKELGFYNRLHKP